MKRQAKTLLLTAIFTVAGGWMLFGQQAKDRVYVGERVCRQCHHLSGNRNQFNPWRLSKHALAYATLSKPEAKEIAELSGIDVDPHESPICLGCHTTAYNVEAWERDDSFHAEDGVQCELCHGPGSEYTDADIMRDPEKARQAGLLKPEERDCMVCHKEKGSHIAVLDVRKFDYKEALKEITHPGLDGPLYPVTQPPAGPLTGPEYVGVLACDECHGEASAGRIYGKWRTSKHAQAYAILSTERAREIRSEMGISGNPQKSDRCLECHTTIAGESAGRFTESFDPAQGVQCESCHVPKSESGAEAAVPDSVTTAEAGIHDVEKEICIRCHIKGIHGHTFDFETMWPMIDHTKWGEEYTRLEYKTPFNLAVTKNGRRLFVACEASGSLIVVNPKTEEIITEVEIGTQPHFVYLSPDETRAYVSNRGSDDVSIIDTETYQVLSTITVGDEPHEMATNEEGTILYVANAGTYDVSVVDLVKGAEIKRLAASRGPWGVARSPDGQFIYVSNNLPRFGEFRTPAMSEVTVIETERSIIKHRYTVPAANLLQGIDIAPNGEFALVTLIRTKNLVPMTRNLQGWIITNGIGILWKDGRIDQLLLDELSDFFADPTDIVFSKNGRYAFVSGGGVQEIAMIDIKKMKQILENAPEIQREEVLPNHLGISMEYILTRIPVGQSPRGMAVSPDNRYLYVADALDDAISVIDIKKRKRIKVIDLGGPKEITQARYGERIFHSAQYTFERQFSCHSCHPDGHIDGLVYDIEPDGLGINPVDNRTLRGINDTAPFKWKGTNPTLKRQCGPRLAAFFTRIDPFIPEQSAALDRYIITITRPPNRYRTGNELTPAQRRGKRIFERMYDNSGNLIPLTNRCNHCHAPPYYTNREVFDVGTNSWLDTHSGFDVPHLNNIYASPPYLHDGRAQSLDEIWTVYNPDDTHGLTNDLTKDQLNDLIEYLKTL
ncbi:MAG: beta-propeller fold lactonase family protein [Fidelibacterota bacterium]|nr:MAG: beta-propeller fold lactonase family protein [Candidatus Neomarinimicrobiota bacterium]